MMKSIALQFEDLSWMFNSSYFAWFFLAGINKVDCTLVIAYIKYLNLSIKDYLTFLLFKASNDPLDP